MQWVKEFYTRQQEWLQLYTMGIQEHQRRLARTVQEALGSDSQPVLELGAGGGQFAVALAQQGVHPKTLLEERQWEDVVTEIPANGISRFLSCEAKPDLKWTPRLFCDGGGVGGCQRRTWSSSGR